MITGQANKDFHSPVSFSINLRPVQRSEHQDDRLTSTSDSNRIRFGWCPRRSSLQRVSYPSPSTFGNVSLLMTCRRVVYPLDTVKTRLQALPDAVLVPSPPSPILPSSTDQLSLSPATLRKVPVNLWKRVRRLQLVAMLLRIVKSEGIAGVFKGFTANMLNTFSQRKSALSDLRSSFAC